MIKFGGKSEFVLSRKLDRDFLDFFFLHLAIFSLIFSPHLSSLSFISSNFLLNVSSNFFPSKNAHGNQLIDNAYAQKSTLSLTISAVGNLSLTSEFGNITSASVVNKPQVITNESLPLLVRMASISGDNITLNSGKNISLSNTLLNSNNATLLNAKGDVAIANDDSFRDAVNKLAAASASSSSLSSPSSFSASSIKDDAAAARSAATFSAGTDIEINSLGSINVANNYFNTGGSIFMTAANDINNSNYQITAADNVVMSAGNNINNVSTAKTAAEAELNPTKIEAGSIVSLDAGNNINNIGATIKGGDLVYLTAANNVNNLALVSYSINGQTTNKDKTITSGSAKKGTLTTTTISGYTTDSETGLTSNAITEEQALASNARNIKSTLIAQGSIESGGNVVVVAGRNLNNKASNITATGAAYLEATAGDINITTAQLRDRTVTSWGNKKKSGTNTKDTTTNVESNIVSNSNLDLASIAGDINITGSKLNSNNNLTLSAADDVNISAAQNTSFFESTYQKKGMTVSKSSMSVKQTLTNVKSELDAGGDISITSGADTNLIGVKLAAENAAINAGKEINIFSVADKSYSYSSASKSRDLSGIAAGVISRVTPNYAVKGLLNGLGATAVSFALGVGSTAKSNTTTSDKTSNVASILEATGNLTLASNQNLTISGSNLSAVLGNLALNSAGDVNIKAAQNTSYEESNNHKKGFSVVKSSTDIRSSVTNVLSELTAGNDIVIVSGASVGGLSRAIADINIEGANLVASSDLTLNSSGEVNIFAVKDTSYHYSESTKSKMDADKIAAGMAAAGFAGARLMSQADKKSQSQTIQDEIISSSKLQAGNNLTITAKDNLNVIGSSIKSGGDMILLSDKSISILSGQNFHSDQSSQSKISLTNGKISEKESTKITQVASEVEAGTGLLMMSGNGTNIGSSNITTTSGDAAIVVGKYVDDAGVEIYNKDAELNIFALKDSETTFERTDKWKVSLNDWTSIRNGHLPIKMEYNHLGKEAATESSVSSNLNIGGNLLINSASNSNIIASNVLSSGDTAIIAGKMLVNGALQENDDANINIFSAKDLSNSEVKTGKITIDPKLTFNSNGFNIGLGTGSYSKKDDYLEKNVASNLMIGGDLTLDAGNNISLLASNLLVNGNAALIAKNKVNILAQETNSTSNATTVSGANSLDFRIDSNAASLQATVEVGFNDSENKNTDYVSSNVSAKSIAINSGKDINILASNLLATDGDIALTSKKGNVNILSAQELKSLSSLNLRVEGGIKVGVTYNIGKTFDSFTALKSVNVDKVVKSLIGVTTNLLSGDSIDEILDGNEEGLNDLSTLLNAGGKGGSAGIMFHLEGEGDYIKQSDSTAKASSLIASNNVTIKAGLGGADPADKSIGNIAATGSLIQAGNDVTLTAANDINLKSSSNLSKFYNIGGSLYVDIPIIGGGFSLGGELHAARNKDTTYNNTKIEAGNNFTLNSGHDTNLIGANIAAANVTLNVQNNLHLESQQNINQYRSFAIGGGYGNANGGKSGNASIDYAKNDRKWVDDQTTIIGSNSVTINTGNNTNLVGAMIANIKADGTDGNNLALNTKSLTYSNIYDQDKGMAFGVSASYSDKPATNKPGTATTAKTQGGGNSSFNLNYASHEKEQTNHATIRWWNNHHRLKYHL